MEQVCAQAPRQVLKRDLGGRAMMGDSDQEEGDQGDNYLDTGGVLGGAEEFFDAQVLLPQLKKSSICQRVL